MNKFQENIHKQIQSHLIIMENNNLPWEYRGTSFIGLAYEYFNMNEDEKGLELLMQIPSQYYENYMIPQLKENEDFLQVTLLLIDEMIKSNFVEKDSAILKSFFKLKGSIHELT